MFILKKILYLHYILVNRQKEGLKIMKYTPKMNRYEKKANLKAISQQLMAGTGVHVYQNVTSGDMYLPKPAMGGRKVIPKGSMFQGDSYFDSMIGKGLRKISTLATAPVATALPEVPPKLESLVEHSEVKGEIMSEEKLILDQPERFTDNGQTEQVVIERKKKKKLNEGTPSNKETEKPKLINEDPMSGVEIILN